ncbi:MAG: hypothetical protein IKR14_06985, partial [Lachnospiraceae bacterium]|nr:hypothetical protein [Lachnospiraceae bacterium]
MSKKLVEGTIKIASVGMAAVMATTPMATLAADADVVSSDAQPTVEDTQTNQADEKQEIKEAAVAVADAQTAVEGANDLMDTTLDSNEAMGEGAITKLPTATIPEGDVDAAEGELSDLAQNISDMKDANTEADAAEAENNGYIADAGEVASELNADMSTAASDFAARRDAMNNAATTDDTDAAYAQAVAIADAAQAEFNEKSAEYEDILQKISDNNAVIAAAQARYDEAVANASENLEDAKTELAAAKQLATELEAAAEAKKNELLQSGAAAIIAAQDADFTKNGNKTGQKEVDWNYKAKIMTAIIEKYYVPDQLKGTNAKATRVQVGEDKVGKEASTDGNAHYYQVTYKDDKGVKHTDYLNYKLDANGDIIIFQKVEKTIDLYRYKVTTIDAKGKQTTNYYEEEQVDGKSVIRVGNDVYDVATINVGDKADKYVVLSDGEEDTDTKIEIGDTENNGLTEVTAINSGDAEVVDEYIDANGKLVKVSQVKGSVTKVTTFNSELTYDDAATAKAEGEAYAAENGTQVGDVTVTSETTYTATASYIPKFTVTIDVSGAKEGHNILEYANLNDAKEDSAKDLAKKQYGYYKDILKNAGYTVEDDYGSDIKLDDGEGNILYKEFTAQTGSTITVTFTKKKEHNDTVSENTLRVLGESIDIFGWFHDKNNTELDRAKSEAAALVKTNNGFEAERNWFNWNGSTANVKYYTGTTVATTGTSTDVAKAEAAASAALAADLENNTAYKNNKISELLKNKVISYSTTADKSQVVSIGTTKYGYSGQYQTTADNQVISETTTTYEAAKLDHVHTTGMYGNDNYNAYLVDGNEDHIVMFENKETGKDLGLNNFLQEYRDKKGAYETLASQAQAAKNAYITAEEKVNAIQASIDALKEQAKVAGLDANQIALQAELTVALEQAERDMDEAETKLNGITDQLAALLVEHLNESFFRFLVHFFLHQELHFSEESVFFATYKG